MVAAQAYFLPPLGQPGAQPAGYRGHPQGNQYWGDLNKIEESYNNRFLYQSPNYQQFSDSQRYASQGSLQAQQQYGPPPSPQQLYQAGINPGEMVPESVYSDVRGTPIFVQPYDEETTRQQTISVVPQYSGISNPQSANAIPYDISQQSMVEEGAIPNVQGLQTTAQTTIPVLVRVSDKQSLIVPVRAVYALPGFLERLVQRVQGYYSIYNPVESLAIDRPYYVPTNNVQVNSGVIANNLQPLKPEIVQIPNLDVTATGGADASSVLDVKVDDLKQVEVNQTSVADNSAQNSTDATTEEAKVENNSDDATTVLPSSSSSVTEQPSPSPSTESSSTAVTTSVPSEEPTTVISDDKRPEEIAETTTQPETAETSKPEEPAAVVTTEAPKPANEDNSSDLQSAGYTYYRPRIPFYYPSRV